MFKKDHRMDENNIGNIKTVNNCKFLNAFESLEMHRNKRRLINSNFRSILTFSVFLLVESGWK